MTIPVAREFSKNNDLPIDINLRFEKEGDKCFACAFAFSTFNRIHPTFLTAEDREAKARDFLNRI